MRYFEVPAERRGKRQLPLRDAQPHMLYQNRQVILSNPSHFLARGGYEAPLVDRI
jgi:hypothetical protein